MPSTEPVNDTMSAEQAQNIADEAADLAAIKAQRVNPPDDNDQVDPTVLPAKSDEQLQAEAAVIDTQSGISVYLGSGFLSDPVVQCSLEITTLHDVARRDGRTIITDGLSTRSGAQPDTGNSSEGEIVGAGGVILTDGFVAAIADLKEKPALDPNKKCPECGRYPASGHRIWCSRK